MDNDDATIGRIFSRREVLAMTGSTGLFLAFGTVPTVFGQTKQKLIASPALTEGPFFVDEKLNRSNILGTTSRKAVTGGTQLKIKVQVLKLVDDAYKPFTEAQVDLWHCDVEGVYSDVSHPMNHENTSGQNWLRGYQITDAKGGAVFETIVPGCYPGRAPHIHFKVRKHNAATNKTADMTSQMFFAEVDARKVYAQKPYSGAIETTNSRDGIFNERTVDGSIAGEQLLLKLRKTADGYEAQLTIVLTDQNFNSKGRGGSELEIDWANF
jgi:protocatechuate 3,4-dioxygenase beta subunit